MRKELGINTYQDLINLFPNRYIDRTRFYRTSELQSSNSEVQLIGKITSFKEIVQKRGKRLVATFKDDTGFIELVWFRGHKWIHEQLKTHTDYVVFGKVNLFIVTLLVLGLESVKLDAKLVNKLTALLSPISIP